MHSKIQNHTIQLQNTFHNVYTKDVWLKVDFYLWHLFNAHPTSSVDMQINVMIHKKSEGTSKSLIRLKTLETMKILVSQNKFICCFGDGLCLDLYLATTKYCLK